MYTPAFWALQTILPRLLTMNFGQGGLVALFVVAGGALVESDQQVVVDCVQTKLAIKGGEGEGITERRVFFKNKFIDQLVAMSVYILNGFTI